MSSKLEAALAWARRGFRVFPLQVNSKDPLDLAWTLHATCDETTIRGWWVDPVLGSERDYNIGFLTTGWVVPDVDVKAGKPGLETMGRLGLSFDTLCMRTPTGGYHLLYRGLAHPVGQSPLGPGVDVRSHNGYVVAPGSTIDGVPYVVEIDQPILEFPEHLRHLLKIPRRRPDAMPADVELDAPETVEVVAHWLRHDAQPAVEGENGDDTTYRVCCRIRDFGISESQALDLFLEEYDPRCSPEWGPDAARLKIENAYRYATGGAGALSPMAAFGHVVPISKPRAHQASRASERTIEVVRASAFASRDVPQRSWIVSDLLPDRQVTILSGDGGVGKSLLALQLGVSAATGSDWIGTMPVMGPVLYLGAEDEFDELHRRLADIANEGSANLCDLRDLHLLSLAGQDAVLAAPDKSGLIEMTALWLAVEEKLGELQPRLLIIDNSADVFAGNEISRAQVRQFVSVLRAAAMRYDMAVLLLSHPSLTGINSGSGTSGSTAWSNSARSRLYLRRPTAKDGAQPDPDVRVLEVMKANYATTGIETRLRWKAGVLRRDGAGLSAYDQQAAATRVETKFIELLATLQDQGREVSHKPGPTYAPRVFERQPNADGINHRGFRSAMERLFAAGKIRVEERGPPSKRRSKIVIA